jgi:hypothetical protein
MHLNLYVQETAVMMHLDNVLKEWIPYRLESLRTFLAVWELVNETNQQREVQILVDGKPRFVGNVAMIANPICEIGLIHARSLLEFLGLNLVKGELKTRERKRNTDDIAIEHFKANGITLERRKPEDVLRDYSGDPDDAKAAFMAIFEWANKGIAHITEQRLSREYTEDHLRIALSGIEHLVSKHLYIKLGMTIPINRQ